MVMERVSVSVSVRPNTRSRRSKWYNRKAYRRFRDKYPREDILRFRSYSTNHRHKDMMILIMTIR